MNQNQMFAKSIINTSVRRVNSVTMLRTLHEGKTVYMAPIWDACCSDLHCWILSIFMCFVTALYWTKARLLHRPQETFLKHFLTTSYLSYHSKLSLTKITKWIKKPIKAALVSVLTSVSESDQTNEAEAELLHCFRTSVGFNRLYVNWRMDTFSQHQQTFRK